MSDKNAEEAVDGALDEGTEVDSAVGTLVTTVTEAVTETVTELVTEAVEKKAEGEVVEHENHGQNAHDGEAVEAERKTSMIEVAANVVQTAALEAPGDGTAAENEIQPEVIPETVGLCHEIKTQPTKTHVSIEQV